VFTVLVVLLLATGPGPRNPKNCRAIPDYGDNSIIVEWDDVNNDQGYRLFRATDSAGPFVQQGPDLPQDTVLYIDLDLDPTREYFYYVRSFHPDEESDPSNTFQQNLKVLWPNPGNLALLHNWNEMLGLAGDDGLGYHIGCDIQQIGSTQNAIVVPRGGVVARIGNLGFDNNHIYVEVKTGSILRYDLFNHLEGNNSGALGPALGDYVRAGEIIGEIGNGYFTWDTVDFVDHTHFGVKTDPFTNEVDGEHPLKIFQLDAERDPQEVRPVLFDHADPPDGTVLFHRQGAAPGPPYLSLPLGDDPGTVEDEGNVDIHVEIADDMNGGVGTTHVPTSVAWWIEGRECDSGPPVVRDPATPYMLFRWDHHYYLDEGVDWHWLMDEAQDLAPGIRFNGVDYPSTWNNYKHFVVTNTRGSDGEGEHVDPAQYWNTNALDDGSSTTVEYANFAGRPDATRAEEARFPDGDYTLHVIATDLLGAQEEEIPGIGLENFPPAVQSVCGGTTLQVSFSEPMDVSATESGISIEPVGGAPVVSLIPSWSAGDCVLELIPDPLPGPADTYQITIDAGTVRDRSTRLLDGAFGSSQHNGVSEGATLDSVSAVVDFGPLAEVGGVRLEPVPGASRISWAGVPGAETYSITRGLLSALSAGEYGPCLVPAVATPEYDDADEPSPGEGYAYLVQAANASCATVGGLGQDSGGELRINADPDACP
jgi:hypothetical protein